MLFVMLCCYSVAKCYLLCCAVIRYPTVIRYVVAVIQYPNAICYAVLLLSSQLLFVMLCCYSVAKCYLLCCAVIQ